jgi:DNA polymerase I-like protein with 3'-5' exonuclease and polymerase domains
MCRKNGVKTIGQFHDEIIALVKEGEEQQIQSLMERAIEKVNDKIQLNVDLGVDAQFGRTYADVH